eukprot:CAMPEP_0172200750 /NCGR_PEP_ID=MMETSP1050-20130122/29534_1 /TAXON_ID=233186 /ORGANISM="Cryptomonas curvata, Strain CCAP979/52" /LENGTH=77 /DNA_ID=CAMNT_0012878153 /DNA_START=84 /DNA_END=314 /DNA_ORIENTATION=+
MSKSDVNSSAYAHSAKDDGQSLQCLPRDWRARASQMGGISNIDREAAVPLSCTGIRFVERARFLRIQFEPSKDSGSL